MPEIESLLGFKWRSCRRIDASMSPGAQVASRTHDVCRMPRVRPLLQDASRALDMNIKQEQAGYSKQPKSDRNTSLAELSHTRAKHLIDHKGGLCPACSINGWDGIAKQWFAYMLPRRQKLQVR